MKRFLILLFLATILFDVPAVKADVYDDGLKVLVKEGAVSVYGTSQLGAMQSDILDTIVVALAPHYRNNMTEKEFKQMLDFYSREDVKAANGKLANPNAMEEKSMGIVIAAVMQIVQGQVPDDIAPVECDKEYLNAFEKYYALNKAEETFSNVIDPMTSAMEQNIGNLPEDQKKQAKATMSKLIDYIGRNLKSVMLNSIKDNVTIAELNLLSSVADQPFYAASKKAEQSCLDDIGNVTGKILQFIKNNK